MTRVKLSSRDRRAISLGFICAVPVVLWSFAVRPYIIEVEVRHARIERQRDLLTREREVLGEAAAYAGRAAAANSALTEAAAGAFHGRDPVAATARFARLVSEEASRREVLIERLNPRPSQASTAGTEIRLSVTAIGDVTGLLRWLQAMESSSRRVMVERLEIRRTAGMGEAPLRASLELLAYAVANSGGQVGR